MHMLVSLALFMGIAKAHSLGYIRWVPAAILVVIGPFIINHAVIGLLLSGEPFTLAALFTPNTLLTLGIQFPVSFLVFRYMEVHEESIVSWLLAVVVGVSSLYVIVPHVSGLIIPG